MHLLIPAAGRGRRMGADQNKLLLPLLDRPVIAWTLQAAQASHTIEWIGLLAQPRDYPAFQTLIEGLNLSIPIEIIEGGSTRQESVSRGVNHLMDMGDVEHVLIHDGARCLVTPELLDRCSVALQEVNGLIAAVPVKDTIKLVEENPIFYNRIESTPDRQRLWAAQTPQGFLLPLLEQAHGKAMDLGWQVTDDAALFERLDLPVYIVEGQETNLKITTPLDLIIAEMVLQRRHDGSGSEMAH